jgi:3-hydroxyisobutyrate dehydrogenase-like beta-hydroxyacid dehydrogenase
MTKEISMSKTIALLNPGEMGAAVGACLAGRGNRVRWASEGRSSATRKRADAAGLEDVQTVKRALDGAEIVLSICPPHAARDVAREVAALGFRGIYVDANAVAPATVREVGSIVSGAGARWIDGGIVGSAPGPKSSTRLYLAGDDAADFAALFKGSYLNAVVLDGPLGSASALKVCYAAWTKGSTALLADIRSLAQAEGVDAALLAEWRISQAGTDKKSERATDAARKAWRWIAEMEEIAASFETVGLPGDFHLGAAEIYRRLVEFKDTPQPPKMEEVTRALLKKKN